MSSDPAQSPLSSPPLSPLLKLNNGVEMPALGLGVGSIEGSAGRAVGAVDAALRAGYRLVDTASVYGNEAEVADGLQKSGVPREDVFITTKLWVDDYGHDSTLEAFETSLRELRTDHVDLYLLHQPLSEDFAATIESYRAMEALLAEGRVRAIGVCNFSERHLADLAAGTEVTPAVNQVELHPYFSQPALQRTHLAAGTITQAWSPIGGVLSWNPSAADRPSPLVDPVVTGIAEKHDKTPAQVLLRWHLDSGRSAIPKSWRPERIRENFDVLDLALTAQEVAAIDALDTQQRGGREPDSVVRTP